MMLTQQEEMLSEIFIPPPDTTARSPDSTGQILVFYEIYRVGDSARSLINFAPKGILVILTGYFCSEIANSEFIRWKSLISGIG
jgi:hypothetical protein